VSSDVRHDDPLRLLLRGPSRPALPDAALEGHERARVTFDDPQSRSLLQHERVPPSFFPATRNVPNAIRNLGLAVRMLRSERPDVVDSGGAGADPTRFRATSSNSEANQVIARVGGLIEELVGRPRRLSLIGRGRWSFHRRRTGQSERTTAGAQSGTQYDPAGTTAQP